MYYHILKDSKKLSMKINMDKNLLTAKILQYINNTNVEVIYKLIHTCNLTLANCLHVPQ